MSNQDGPIPPRVFRLCRDTDETGVSGTGQVAWVVSFPDGKTVTRWVTSAVGVSQVGVFDHLEDVLKIHGHNGQTRLEEVLYAD